MEKGEENDGETRERGRGFPLFPLPSPSPLPSPGTQATLAILFPLTEDEVVSLFSIFHSVVLLCSDKISSFTARVRVSHRVSSTML